MSSAPEAAPTDLPSGDPIPSSAPPSYSKKSAPSVIQPTRELLAAAPANLDEFLAHLQRCLSTPSGIDTVLLFVCYTSRLAASLLQHATQPALRRRAEQLVALASSLPPSATLLFPRRVFPGGGVAAILAVARSLKNLSVLLSEARTFLRLWGLLGMYFWGKRLAAAPPAPLPERALAYGQLAACVVFQALENGTYLAAKGVLPWAPATQAVAGRWSARFWGTFVFLELGRLLLEARRRGRRTRAEKFAPHPDGTPRTATAVQADELAWADTWRKTFARNLAWAPLTVHWSLESGLVSETAIGALASIPGCIAMRDLWRRTAE
ncbi:hypothetical protein F4780DRAFT_772610 [Xylariomycetidae sp. FL0641]|nr:hypothetical protein F4780DRAFT_772610 [Xylariomycetidae sp. FL0641]